MCDFKQRYKVMKMSEAAYQLCKSIEMAGADKALTECSILAATLRQKLDDWENSRPMTAEENELIERGLEQIKTVDKYREALEMIAGERQCVNSLMSNADIARSALYT